MERNGIRGGSKPKQKKTQNEGERGPDVSRIETETKSIGSERSAASKINKRSKNEEKSGGEGES